MTTFVPHFPRHMVVGLSGILIAAIVAGSFAFFLLPRSSNTFAATLQQTAGMTCAQAATMAHCNNQDLELQGCAEGAVTLVPSADIKENGVTIGSVERRWSARCQSWWGRVFDYRAGSQANMYIAIASTTLSAAPTFVSHQYRILYSFMIFDATPTQQVPAITGTLEVDGTAPLPSATLPAITVPGK
ncbi:MAG TPA: hypothetical protein VFV38_41225 [Ktedonobacteraceae bacterium]|nr:hypothetical protein [Ktedonobacteraceae bacterium]